MARRPLVIYNKTSRIRIWPDGMTTSIPVNSSCNSSFTRNFVFPKAACLAFYFCVWAAWLVVSGFARNAEVEQTERSLQGKRNGRCFRVSLLPFVSSCPTSGAWWRGIFSHPLRPWWKQKENRRNSYIPGLRIIVSFPCLVNVSLIGLVSPLTFQHFRNDSLKRAMYRDLVDV